jgi:nitrogen fixation protein NifX
MPLERQMTVVRCESFDHAPAAAGDTIRVALATSDLCCVDENFGSATKLAIYDVGPESARLRGVSEFNNGARDGKDDQLLHKFDVLEECQAVFGMAISPSAVRQLMAMGVQPIKLGKPSLISEILSYLAGEIEAGQASWIGKALRRPQCQCSWEAE